MPKKVTKKTLIKKTSVSKPSIEAKKTEVPVKKTLTMKSLRERTAFAHKKSQVYAVVLTPFGRYRRHILDIKITVQDCGKPDLVEIELD